MTFLKSILRLSGLWGAGLLLLSLPWISACANTAITFSPQELPSVILYQTYHATVTITGFKTPVGYIGISDGALPDGLTISYEQGTNVATISGDPTLLGNFVFTLNAWCMGTNKQGQSGYHKYEILVAK